MLGKDEWFVCSLVQAMTEIVLVIACKGLIMIPGGIKFIYYHTYHVNSNHLIWVGIHILWTIKDSLIITD